MLLDGVGVWVCVLGLAYTVLSTIGLSDSCIFREAPSGLGSSCFIADGVGSRVGGSEWGVTVCLVAI